jgi:hypothetical protein
MTDSNINPDSHVDAAEAKKPRSARPIYMLVPRPSHVDGDGIVEGGGYDLFKCKGLEEVRKTLADQGLDPTDERVEGIVLLRGDEVVFKVSQQVVFKFGSRAG